MKPSIQELAEAQSNGYLGNLSAGFKPLDMGEHSWSQQILRGLLLAAINKIK